MTGEMKPLTRDEVNRLMKKLSMESQRVRREFVERNRALAVGEERYQNFLCSLPKTAELRRMMGEDFEIHETINGWMIKRLR